MASDDEYRLDHEPIKGAIPATDLIDEAFERFAVRGEHVPALAAMMQSRRRLAALRPRSPGDDEDRRARERQRVGRAIFEHVINAVLIPSKESDRWLSDTRATLRKSLSLDARRVLALQAIRESVDIEDARSSLELADRAFAKLPDDALQKALLKVQGRAGGATHRGVPSVAAELSLAVHAFGDQRQPNESATKATERVADAYRKANKRQTRSDQTKQRPGYLKSD